MLSVFPDFYGRFACRAAACGHSCCRGWEIDVDEESASYYRALPGPLGDELREALRADEEGWHFRLDEAERCPFLQPDGLCRLILRLGEDALCDICALHPRFFLRCGDWELAGLGLSCEAAAALLLEGEGPLRFVTENKRLTLPALLDALGWELPREALRFVPSPDPAALLDALEQTEPIDGRWPEELRALREALPRLPVPLPDPAAPRWQRMFDYILYRQLDRLETDGPEALLRYARDSVSFVLLQDRQRPDTAEHLRRWSEQVEYSTENVDILLSLQA